MAVEERQEGRSPDASPARIVNYADFFDFYLMEHRSPRSRALHYLGTMAASALVIAAIVSGTLWLLLLALLMGYGPAWIGHFVFERNRPATFRYPLWSLVSDYRMVYLWLRGEIDAALQAAEQRTGRAA